MLAILIMVAYPVQSGAATETQRCEHLDRIYVASVIKQVDNELALNPYNAPSLGELAKYWKKTCRNDRYNASKHIVMKLSDWLSHWEVVVTVVSMMIDIGPNIIVARHNIDAALLRETAREDAIYKASGPIVPTSGRTLSSSLKCLKIKMETGRLDERYCSYIRYAGG